MVYPINSDGRYPYFWASMPNYLCIVEDMVIFRGINAWEMAARGRKINGRILCLKPGIMIPGIIFSYPVRVQLFWPIAYCDGYLIFQKPFFDSN